MSHHTKWHQIMPKLLILFFLKFLLCGHPIHFSLSIYTKTSLDPQLIIRPTPNWCPHPSLAIKCNCKVKSVIWPPKGAGDAELTTCRLFVSSPLTFGKQVISHQTSQLGKAVRPSSWVPKKARNRDNPSLRQTSPSSGKSHAGFGMSTELLTKFLT